MNQTSSSSYANSTAWLQGQSPVSIDYQAQRIHALNLTDSSINALIPLLDQKTQAWGGDDGYVVDALDTASVIQALKAANYTDLAAPFRAMQYLGNIQKTDGGWGFTQDDDSRVFVTSQVVFALAQYKKIYMMPQQLGNAATFLLSKQNPDGGFGDGGSSSVFETALAFIALVEGGQPQCPQLQNAINYLTANQLTDGSWNDDPYSTALALRALSYVKPDLAVQPANIAVSPSAPSAGGSITVTATVPNIGFDTAANVTVRLLDNGVSVGDQAIASIAPGGTGQAVFAISPLQPVGEHILTVAVDPNNAIVEIGKANNSAATRIWAKALADLVVQPEYLAISPAVPKPGDSITLNAGIANMGETDAGPFSADLYDGDPNNGGTKVGSFSSAGIAAGQWGNGSVTFSLSTAGVHTLFLVVDPQSVISEQSKANNVAQKSITVSVTGQNGLADLTIPLGGVQISPTRPKNGDSTTITVMARNLGTAGATANLELFDGPPTSGGTLLHQELVTLSAGESRTVSVPWTATPGIHTMYAVIDRAGLVAESDETNNSQMLTVMTDMVDIEVSAADISISPEVPMDGDAATVSAVIRNKGIAPTGDFNVNLYNGDPANGGTLLQSFAISSLAGDASQTISYPFTAARGTYRFYVVCDPENKVMEADEGNNLAIRSLLVKSSTDAKGPDLVPLTFDLSGATTDPQTLRISGVATVKFQNKGDDKVTTPFRITVFEDRDGDGVYTEGTDLALGYWDYSAVMNPNMVASVSIELSGTVTFKDSPIYAVLDSGQVVFEQNKKNNTIRKGSACESRPANPIQPVLKWKMNTVKDPTFGRITSTPVVLSLNDTNGDGRIDSKDAPVILVNTYSGNYPIFDGKIWALDGKTGTPVMSHYILGEAPYEGGPLLVGDIDGDGKPEIVVAKRGSTSGLLAFANDGSLKWDNSAQLAAWVASHPYIPSTLGETGNPAIADLDGDGKVEMIYSTSIINSDGSMRCSPDSRLGGGLGKMGSLGNVLSVADLDLDGKQEIIAGNTAYNSDCSVKWINRSVVDGYVAIGNFHDGPYPEIVVQGGASGRGLLYLLEHDGTIKWGPVYNSPYSSVPIIADFDGDGKPEIGIQSSGQYQIYDGEGRLKLSFPLPGGYDWNLAPSVFDLNGDGIPEILFNSNGYFVIYSGKDGTLLYQEHTGDSGAVGQNVIIADVDGDGHAEAVVVGNYANGGMSGTLRVYGAKNNDWVGTRSTWNEPSYHVTNVNDDGTITKNEAPSWLLNNNYRCNIPVTAGPDPYLASDLSASFVRVDMSGYPASVSVTARVGNGGAIPAPAGIRTAFYDGDPAAGGVVIGSALTTKDLNPGDYEDVTLVWNAPSEGNHTIVVNADADNTIGECNKNNNSVTMSAYITNGKPDLSVVADDIMVPAAIPEGSLANIAVTVRNLGTLPAGNVLVRLFNGNPASGGKQIGGDQVIPAIAAGGMATVSYSWNTLGTRGTSYLYAVVDPANTIAESDENNNTAIKAVTVTPAQKPDLELATEDICISPAAPFEGDALTVVVNVHNLGLATGNVRVTLYNGNPTLGGKTLGTTTIAQIIPQGGTAPATFTVGTIGLAGAVPLFVKIDPNNLIDESDKSNNQASKTISISPAGLGIGIRTDKASYGANESLQATVSLSELNGQQRSLTYDLQILDSNGTLTATAASDVPLSLAPNVSTTFNSTWNTGATYAGNYTVLVNIKQGGRVIANGSAPFAILPVKTVSTAVSADKLAYAANETVTLTGTVTSASPNSQLSNITCRFTIANSGGTTMFSDTRTVTTLLPGSRVQLKSSWNTAASARGTYTVTIEVLDGTNSLSKAQSTFDVTGSASSGAGITGVLAAQPGVVEAGTPMTLSYGITNGGNEDLASFALNIAIADPDSGQILETLATPSVGPLTITQTQTGNLPLATSGVVPKTLLAILQANIQGVVKSIASAPVTIKDTTPPVLSVSTLSDGSYTNNATLNIAGTATDNSGIKAVTVNGLPVQINGDGSFAYALVLSTGANTITTIATDLGGNQSTDTRTIVLDKTAPTVVINSPPDNAITNSAAATITGSVDEQSTVTVKIAGSTVSAAMAGNTFSADLSLAPGYNTIEVTATDRAGNTSTQKRTVLYDDQKPSLAISTPPQDLQTNQSGLLLKGMASDPYTKVSVTITMDGQTYTPDVVDGTFQQQLSFSKESSYAIVVTATNEAGTSSVTQRNVIYDITPPNLTIDPVKSPTEDTSQVITGTRESGLQVDVSCLTASVGKVNYPDDTTWSVSLTQMQTGDNVITATSSDLAGNVTTVSAKITMNDLFSFAVFGDQSVSMSGNSYVDSYSGSPASHVAGQKTHGNVGTNALSLCSINLTGIAQVYGAASVGVGGSPATEVCTSGGAAVQGTVAALSFPKRVAPVADTGGGVSSGALALSGKSTKNLGAGNYRFSSVALSGNSRLNLTGPTTLHVDGDLSLSGGSVIELTSGPVVIFANGKRIDISGGGIVNDSGAPANLVIYGTPNLQTVSFSGGATLHGLIFAPAATVKMTGGQETFGSIVGRTVELSGGASVHYPEP